MDIAVKMTGVVKEFRSRGGRRRAVDGLDLEIPEGGVFGLLGPNGSGKTTTLRMLFGLIRPTRGSITVYGDDVATRLPHVLPTMSGLIEGPQLFPGFTARRNLEILARTGGIRAHRVDEVLQTVELGQRQHDLVKGYSLGMRQRLGIAAALLRSPRLLVLDEPMNGLDPAGMVAIRDLVRQVAADGATTVVLSSHQLSDVERLCSKVAILDQGRLVAAGDPARLAGARSTKPAVLATVRDIPAAIAALAERGLPAHRCADGGRLRVPDASLSNVVAALADAGIELVGVENDYGSLEDVFIELTGRPA